MKLVASLLLTLSLLTGCVSIPQAEVKPSVVVQYKTEVISIPDAALDVPAAVEDIDFTKPVTQKMVADWLARSEGRTKELENKLALIRKIQEEQKKKAEEPK